MLIQKMRLKQGWSQQQLAEASGLSVRTIQRIEGGQPASTETLKSIAAVFDVDFSTLTPKEPDMDASTLSMTPDEKLEEDAFRYVRQLKRFYYHLARYLLVMICLGLYTLFSNTHHIWMLWLAGGWGLAILLQGARILGRDQFFGPDWERQQVEKRLRRPL